MSEFEKMKLPSIRDVAQAAWNAALDAAEAKLRWIDEEELIEGFDVDTFRTDLQIKWLTSLKEPTE